MKKLHRLKNGDWISLESVTAINPRLGELICGIQTRTGVEIRHATHSFVETATFDEALRMADELGEAVNASQPG